MKKYIFMLIFSVFIMFGMMGAVQYYMDKTGSEQKLLAKAERDLKESKRVSAIQAEVESAVRNLMENVQQSLNDPDRYYIISSQLVRKNPHIIGAGVAFAPDYYKNKGKNRLYSPYAYDEQPAVQTKKRKISEPQIRTELLGFDYTEREWFQKPMNDGKPLWTQPYVDKGGTHIILSTYVEPVRDRKGHIIGVFFADVPMEDVSQLSVDINSDLSRKGQIVIIIDLIFMLFFIFVLWLAAKASLRYKEQKVDVEKEQLLAEIEKLKETNRRITQRNMDLSKMLNKKLLTPMLAAILTVSGVTYVQAQTSLSPQASAFKNKYQAQVAKTRGEQVPMVGPFVVTCKMNYSAIGVGEQLEKLGAEVLTAFGRSVVVNIPADQFDAVAETEGVLLIDVGTKGEIKTDITRKATQTEEVQTGTGAKLPQAYTGKDVIIGLIDTGFDFTHPVFKDKNGNLRIKAVYLGGNESVKGESVTVIVKDATGASKQVDLPGAIITDPKVILDTTKVKDPVGHHGTHCAAIAAGSQIEKVSGLTGNLLGGMAPEAELILCTNQYSKEWQKKLNNMPNGDIVFDNHYLNFMSDYAAKQGKPLVMSWSQNAHSGPHNGTSPASMMIGDWCKQGNVMMLCASNEGEDNIYVNETIAAGDSINFAMDVLQGKLNGYYYLKTHEPVKVRVGIYDLKEKKEVFVFPYTIDTGKQASDTIFYIAGKDDPDIKQVYSELSDNWIKMYEQLEPYVKKALCGAYVSQGTIMESHLSDKLVNVTTITLEGIFVPKTEKNPILDIDQNLYAYTLHIIPSKKTEMFSWIDVATYQKNGIFVTGNSSMSMGDWNTTGEPVSVGAWAANNRVKSLADDDTDKSITIGDIASFSSYGTDYASHKHPTACTPGRYVYSAVNSFAPDDYPIVGMTVGNNQFEGQQKARLYYFGSASGTSMATPAAAGIVALWMQAAKDKGKTLTNKDIKDIIAKTADNDEFTKAKPERFGSGKINAYKGLLYVLGLYDPSGISTVSTNQPANVNFRLDGDNLYAEGAEDGTPVSLYGLSGILVRQTSVEAGIVSLAGLQHGVYAVQLCKLGSTLIRK